MAVDITLTNLSSLQNENTAIAALNANNAAIEAAFEDVLALDGTTPNSMLAPLDMNSQAILNLPSPVSGLSPLRLQDYNTLISGGTISVSNNSGIEYVMDGGGAQLSIGAHPSIIIPYSATITGVSLIADQTGSVVIDIWKTSYTNYNPPTHPAVGDSITASRLPTITSGTKYQDTTLTGWTTNINQNDVFAFNINSLTNITRLTVLISVTKT